MRIKKLQRLEIRTHSEVLDASADPESDTGSADEDFEESSPSGYLPLSPGMDKHSIVEFNLGEII